MGDGDSDSLNEAAVVALLRNPMVADVLRRWPGEGPPPFVDLADHVALLRGLREILDVLGDLLKEPDLRGIQAQIAALSNQLGKGEHPRQPGLASPAQARLYIGGVSRQTWDRHVRPHLKSVRIGEREFYEYEELDRWVAEQQVGASSATSGPATGLSASVTKVDGSSDPREREIAEKLRASLLASSKK